MARRPEAEVEVVEPAVQWTAFGTRPQQVRGSMLGIVLALMFAWPVMTSVPAQYPTSMVIIALVGSGWFVHLGLRARALCSLAFVPVGLVWLNPLLGLRWFTAQGPGFFLPHAALAMLFGVAAYTFAASEKG